MSEYHNPVLLEESINSLITDPSGTYADVTFGGGGHSAAILSRLNGDGRLIAFDRDADAVSACSINDPRFTLVHNNFRFIHNYALLLGGQDGEKGGAIFDGILADLGVSSHQFDTPDRGFSFRWDGPLDMRMNASGKRTAADVVNTETPENLEKIFRVWGELPQSHRIASLIVSARAKAPITTTTELDAVLEPMTPNLAGHKWLAKVYQALRIEVNQEMRSLEKFLEGAVRSLKEGGRLVIITYHSLEDRMVKEFIRSGNISGEDLKDGFGVLRVPLKAVTRKPVTPDEKEIASNTRARSAKMRVAQRIMEEGE
ncbi:MAG: 16S rRNA (cytosine(1402)-N(4))-methyltransferase RsmH [Bacteroidales bacterium]|nr:16S rRNA (cytosine(1402)-N(4))-methyltransferase RsmH [Bacteroidales bacterium]